MRRICIQCNVEMKLSPKSINKIEVLIDRTPIPYLVNEGNQYTPHVDIYICPRCGLIQQYVAEDNMDFLKEL